MMGNETLGFDAYVKIATEKAVLFVIEDPNMVNAGEEMWCPKSQVKGGPLDEVELGVVNTYYVSRWWAVKKGLCE